MHKSATVDYGVVLEGERTLLLDRGNITIRTGDVVVQLGNWHGWTNLNGGSLMAFVMMGATFDREPKVLTVMSNAIKPVRRIVTIDDEDGKSVAIADGPPPDVQGDPARAGFSSARIWVTDASPPQMARFAMRRWFIPALSNRHPAARCAGS